MVLSLLSLLVLETGIQAKPKSIPNRKIQTADLKADPCVKPTGNYDPNTFMKIDPSGKYCWFPGVNLISPISNENRNIWEKIHEGLQQLPSLTEYYSLLPVKSYHMTVNNLFTERWDHGGNWNALILNHLPWFQNLHKGVQALRLQPKAMPESVVVSGIIYLPLHLEESQIEKIHHLAKEFHVGQLVPSEFHVTLGYLYKQIPEVIRISIHNEAQAMIKKTLKATALPLRFEEPKLHYFHAMTEFIPWNGESNPF